MNDVDAVVTGAGRGLGRGISEVLAAAGARVWMVADVAAELDWAAARIRDSGGRAIAHVADVTRERDRERLVSRLVNEAPALQVIVNNAAILERVPVQSLDKGHWDRTLQTNLEAPVFLVRDLLPHLTAEGGSSPGGSVVNVSSRAGTEAFPLETAYCASKFGIEAFTRCLAQELASLPVSVNSVTPGIRLKPTGVTREAAAAMDPRAKERWADPALIGPAFVFLARLRGEVSGRRFDARVLTQALEEWGPQGVLARVDEVTEA